MSRRIGLLVAVESKYGGTPVSFIWRGARYQVLHVNEPWRLQDRWWMSQASQE